MPVAKIIILNWNGADHLRRFLPSVVAGAPPRVAVIGARNRSAGASPPAAPPDAPQTQMPPFLQLINRSHVVL